MRLDNRWPRWVVGARAEGRIGGKLTAIECVGGGGKGGRGIKERLRCINCLNVVKACEKDSCMEKGETHVGVQAMYYSKIDCNEGKVLVQRDF